MVDGALAENENSWTAHGLAVYRMYMYHMSQKDDGSKEGGKEDHVDRDIPGIGLSHLWLIESICPCA